jgi:hypothetical protein
MQLGGKLRSVCDPWSVLAKPEPPGRLHTSTGTPYEGELFRLHGTDLTSAYPDYSGAFSVTDRAAISQNSVA